MDGTLYDSIPLIYGLDCNARIKLGYPKISLPEYLNNFQTSDWNKFYRDTGIREVDIDKVIKVFESSFSVSNQPPIIPGAREIIRVAQQRLGYQNVGILSNAPMPSLEFRLNRDDLSSLLGTTRSTYCSKTQELLKLAQANPDEPFFYVGDTISDAECSLQARALGAENLSFCGMIHEYAMSNPNKMIAFAQQHCDFAKTYTRLQELSQLWDSI